MLKILKAKLQQYVNCELPDVQAGLRKGKGTRESVGSSKKQESSRKNEEAESKQKQCPVVDVTGDGSKVRCCKEQYCLGTWNVRPMNQGKSEVVKQNGKNEH